MAALRNLLQQLLTCMNFPLESEELSFWYKQKSDFYELWQQHKQLKTMEMYAEVPTFKNQMRVKREFSEPASQLP